MIFWEETYDGVKPRLISFISDLVGQLISHGGSFPVVQLFSWRMVFSSLGIPHVLTIIICTQLIPERLPLRLLMYVPCLLVHCQYFSYFFGFHQSISADYCVVKFQFYESRAPIMETGSTRTTPASTQPLIYIPQLHLAPLS